MDESLSPLDVTAPTGTVTAAIETRGLTKRSGDVVAVVFTLNPVQDAVPPTTLRSRLDGRWFVPAHLPAGRVLPNVTVSLLCGGTEDG